MESVITADQGEQSNVDLSKNNPIVAPAFGSNNSYLPGSGEPLYPFLGTSEVLQTVPNAAVIPLPNAFGTPSAPNMGNFSVVVEPITPAYSYTEVTGDMYYSGGYLGRVKIPALGVNVKVYEGTDSETLAKGAGHFEDTSIWEGNICIAGHNRGTNCYFGEIHTLKTGDTITFTTKAGTRTYRYLHAQPDSGEPHHALHLCPQPKCLPLVCAGGGGQVICTASSLEIY